jgi:hypothetical protein
MKIAELVSVGASNTERVAKASSWEMAKAVPRVEGVVAVDIC